MYTGVLNESINRFYLTTNALQIIACEIKMRRIGRGITLEQLANSTCSVSYISKIENMQIKPNQRFLQEICGKLSINSVKLKDLVNSEDYLTGVISGFFKGDAKKVKYCYSKMSEFVNFRKDVMEMIYSVFFDNLSRSLEIMESLNKIVNNMPQDDRTTFLLFKGIIFFKCDKILEAVNCFKKILEEKSVSNVLLAICYEYLMRISYETNSISFSKYKKIALENFVKMGNLEKIEEYFKLEFFYNIKNRNFDLALENMERFCGCPKENDYRFYLALTMNKPYECHKDSLESTFSGILYDILNGQKICEDKKNQIKSVKETILIEYLCKQKEYKIAYLEDTCFPHATQCLDGFFISLYGQILKSHYESISSYKKANAISSIVYECINKINRI